MLKFSDLARSDTQTCIKVGDGEMWVPSLSLNESQNSWWQRVKDAWAVLTRQAQAIKWE